MFLPTNRCYTIALRNSNASRMKGRHSLLLLISTRFFVAKAVFDRETFVTEGTSNHHSEHLPPLSIVMVCAFVSDWEHSSSQANTFSAGRTTHSLAHPQSLRMVKKVFSFFASKTKALYPSRMEVSSGRSTHHSLPPHSLSKETREHSWNA